MMLPNDNRRRLGGGHMRADWGRTKALYRQCLEAIDLEGEAPYLPSQLPSFLSELLSRLSVGYFDAYDEFITDAANELDPTMTVDQLYADQRFRQIPEYSLDGQGRRKPTPFEAIVETCRRLRDIRAVESVLAERTVGGVLGGSASYGRFLNVQGSVSGTPSDADFLVVVEDASSIESVIDGLSAINGASAQGISRSRERMREYLEFIENEHSTPTVFSCKIPMWDGGVDEYLSEVGVDPRYHLSFHIIPMNAARLVFMSDFLEIKGDARRGENMLRDFRETAATRSDHQRSFSGRNLRIELASVAWGSSFVRETRAYVIDDRDYYFPGMFQNLVLPAFDTRWGNNTFRQLVESLRWKMVERLRYERHVHQDDMLRISYSHTRSAIFSPHVVRAVDASTHLS